MKISNRQIEKVLQGYTQQVQTKKDKQMSSVKDNTEVEAKNDSVAITLKSKELARAKELYAELPDVREEKIKEVRERLQKGNQVSSEEIAEKIIYQSLIDGEV